MASFYGFLSEQLKYLIIIFTLKFCKSKYIEDFWFHCVKMNCNNFDCMLYRYYHLIECFIVIAKLICLSERLTQHCVTEVTLKQSEAGSTIGPSIF